jgi:DNA-binding MarR family transcriptional regulator
MKGTRRGLSNRSDMVEAAASTSDSEAGARLQSAVAQFFSGHETVLAASVRSGPIGLSNLARDEGMNPDMVSRIVGKLEKSGLVVQRPGPTDGGVVFVEATPAGRRLYERIRTERTDALNRTVERLSVDERIANDLRASRS